MGSLSADEKFFVSEMFREARGAAPARVPRAIAVREPARDIPVYRRCDVLVVGGGPVGHRGRGRRGAAGRRRRAARALQPPRRPVHRRPRDLDRPHDRLGGPAGDPRLRRRAVRPPARRRGRRPVARRLGLARRARRPRTGRSAPRAYHGVVTWSPTIDPERLKLLSQEIVLERKVKLIYHSLGRHADRGGRRGQAAWCSRARKAAWRSRAKVVVDATGDGDMFARAGAAYDNDIEEADVHHCMNTSWLFGGVDMDALDRIQGRPARAVRRLHAARARAAAACSSGPSSPGATTSRCSWARASRAIRRSTSTT